ncbi:helix-turn-helix transcriptional regulator [Frankia sp. AgB1.9]|nr:helix-turn-helix transcriptional regulator [Frankia sp. AgW1.1]MBL7548250.1 helix-turn-helix transcriptional regulator [Frankia sp. AgB1.9]
MAGLLAVSAAAKGSVNAVSWAERAADRSPSVQRSRLRTIQQAKLIVQAARRLVNEKGDQFTTQELAREAGVALQTFYRHFPGKDQLMVAVIEDLIAESAEAYAEAAKELPDPVARLRYYVLAMLSGLDAARGSGASTGGADGATGEAGPRFVTAQHWRLHQRFPEDMAHAIQPITDLIATELRAGEAAGLLHPTDVDRDAALVTKLLMTVYHHHAFAPPEQPIDEIAAHLWAFCLAAVGGAAPPREPAGPGA